MAALRTYDDETRVRAARMVQDRIREQQDVQVGALRHVGEHRRINPAKLRTWVEIDPGQRPGTPSEVSEELTALRREDVELERAHEIRQLSQHGHRIAPSTY